MPFPGGLWAARGMGEAPAKHTTFLQGAGLQPLGAKGSKDGGDLAPSWRAKLWRSQAGERERLPGFPLLTAGFCYQGNPEGRRGGKGKLPPCAQCPPSIPFSGSPEPQPALTCAVKPGGDGVEEGVLGCQ